MTQDNNYKNNGAYIAGGAVMLFGAIILLKQLNIIDYLNLRWLFNWKVLLIVIGLYSGSKRNFTRPYGWALPLIIGCVFLIGDITNIHLAKFIVPIFLIGAGAIIILNANGHNNWLRRKQQELLANDDANYFGSNNEPYSQQAYNDETSRLNVNSFLGGSHQTITNKNFKSGTVTTFMGGAEINMLQADIENFAVLDLTLIMGGLRLSIPQDWELKNEVSCILGGVDDNRPQVLQAPHIKPKLLILRGTTLMGGVEIKSFNK